MSDGNLPHGCAGMALRTSPTEKLMLATRAGNVANGAVYRPVAQVSDDREAARPWRVQRGSVPRTIFPGSA